MMDAEKEITVGDLVAKLMDYPSDRVVLFIDPDTEWRLAFIVREPRPYELLEGEADAPPLVITAEYSA